MKNTVYARLLRGRIQKELKIQASFVKGAGAEEGKKKNKKFFPQKSENVWVWPFSKGNICKTRGCLLPNWPLAPARPKPNPTGDATRSCSSQRGAVLGDKTKARQVAEGGRTSAREGCWSGARRSGGVPGMLSPARTGVGGGGSISNWQPGLGCPFCGVLFNCTG